jgi:hypothetical protein
LQNENDFKKKFEMWFAKISKRLLQEMALAYTTILIKTKVFTPFS